MAEKTFADTGKMEAIRLLYEGTPYKPFGAMTFSTRDRDNVFASSRTLIEGTDFNLEYFPLPHLGYKAVVSVTGGLYASMAHPKTLGVTLGISAKLDLEQIRELFSGIVKAAREHGYESLDLDLQPSRNGLIIALAATGVCSCITSKRCPAPKSKDLLCISGPLGAAYLGQMALEKRLPLEEYKMLVAACIKPDLEPGIVQQLENEEIYPSAARFVTHGLADAVKALARDTGLGAKVYADKIPFEGNSFQLGKVLNIDPVSAAMNGGDDFRLLLCIPILQMEKFRRNFQTFDIIGHLALPEAGTSLVSPDGLEHPLEAPGWPANEE